MPQVFISVGHGEHAALILVEHEKLSVADRADLTCDPITVLELDRVRESTRAHATIRAVEHGAELTFHRLFQLFLACKAMRLCAHDVVARCIICHFKLEDDLVWIEGVRRTEHADCLDFFHFVPLISCQAFVLLLDPQIDLIGHRR